ncbi:MAG: hypothetical protein ACLTSZ_10875 [Lachnospiraceae bacterium]
MLREAYVGGARMLRTMERKYQKPEVTPLLQQWIRQRMCDPGSQHKEHERVCRLLRYEISA